MSTNKCPKGGVVTRTAGQAGFVSNTSMFHGAWRRKDVLLCDSSQLDISFPQFWWTSPTSPYTFWVFGVLLAIPDPSSENQPVPGKYPEVSCSFQRLEWQPGPSLKPFQGSSAFKASLVATFHGNGLKFQVALESASTRILKNSRSVKNVRMNQLTVKNPNICI